MKRSWLGTVQRELKTQAAPRKIHTEWDSEPVVMLWRRENSPAHAWNRTSCPIPSIPQSLFKAFNVPNSTAFTSILKKIFQMNFVHTSSRGVNCAL